jgi:hypothetical protein
MGLLNPDKLQLTNKFSKTETKSIIPRTYTLTHSDFTGDLFLSIGPDYDDKQISGFYTRLMRDEVLAEWQLKEDTYELHVYLHVSGGIVFGWAGLRDRIFRKHLPLVLETIREGDTKLFQLYPHLDDAPIIVHFNSKNLKFDRIEKYGYLKDYKSI